MCFAVHRPTFSLTQLAKVPMITRPDADATQSVLHACISRRGEPSLSQGDLTESSAPRGNGFLLLCSSVRTHTCRPHFSKRIQAPLTLIRPQKSSACGTVCASRLVPLARRVWHCPCCPLVPATTPAPSTSCRQTPAASRHAPLFPLPFLRVPLPPQSPLSDCAVGS